MSLLHSLATFSFSVALRIEETSEDAQFLGHVHRLPIKLYENENLGCRQETINLNFLSLVDTKMLMNAMNSENYK